jgi:hypothetical protein
MHLPAATSYERVPPGVGSVVTLATDGDPRIARTASASERLAALGRM